MTLHLTLEEVYWFTFPLTGYRGHALLPSPMPAFVVTGILVHRHPYWGKMKTFQLKNNFGSISKTPHLGRGWGKL